MDIESIRVGTVVTEALWPEPLVREPWVSVDDVAKHLGTAKDSIYRWIERKGLPAPKIGRLWKFKLSEVDEWIRAGGAGDDAPEGER